VIASVRAWNLTLLNHVRVHISCFVLNIVNFNLRFPSFLLSPFKYR
jgi:hypothetical protein